MDARKYVWLAVVVLASPLVAPTSARADRLPSRTQSELLFDNDPWRPDTKEPARTLLNRDQSVLESSRPTAREPVQRQTWYQVLLRALQLRVFWGIWR
jgi:hypothetical protein